MTCKTSFTYDTHPRAPTPVTCDRFRWTAAWWREALALTCARTSATLAQRPPPSIHAPSRVCRVSTVRSKLHERMALFLAAGAHRSMRVGPGGASEGWPLGGLALRARREAGGGRGLVSRTLRLRLRAHILRSGLARPGQQLTRLELGRLSSTNPHTHRTRPPTCP